jgi:hypothetical protein
MPHPSEELFERIHAQLCAYAEQASDVELVVTDAPSRMAGRYVVSDHDCARFANTVTGS